MFSIMGFFWQKTVDGTEAACVRLSRGVGSIRMLSREMPCSDDKALLLVVISRLSCARRAEESEIWYIVSTRLVICFTYLHIFRVLNQFIRKILGLVSLIPNFSNSFCILIMKSIYPENKILFSLCFNNL